MRFWLKRQKNNSLNVRITTFIKNKKKFLYHHPSHYGVWDMFKTVQHCYKIKQKPSPLSLFFPHVTTHSKQGFTSHVLTLFPGGRWTKHGMGWNTGRLSSRKKKKSGVEKVVCFSYCCETDCNRVRHYYIFYIYTFKRGTWARNNTTSETWKNLGYTFKLTFSLLKLIPH